MQELQFTLAAADVTLIKVCQECGSALQPVSCVACCSFGSAVSTLRHSDIIPADQNQTCSCCKQLTLLPFANWPLQGLELLKDLLSIEVPLTLNEALCEHHHKHCPASDQLDKECTTVRGGHLLILGCLLCTTAAASSRIHHCHQMY